MSKSILVLFSSLISLGLAQGSPLYPTGALVSGTALSSHPRTADANQMQVARTLTNLGFDVPFFAFAYVLNGAPVSGSPAEVRFNTLSSGGLFDVVFGTGLNEAYFSFQGPQAFTGTTAAPILTLRSFVETSLSYSDPANFNVTATPTAVSILLSPEPSSFLLLLGGFLAFVAVSSSKFAKAF